MSWKKRLKNMVNKRNNMNIDEQYIDLLKDILENGVEKDTRNGKTLSVFGRQIRYKFEDGKFPLLTTKKMYWRGIVTELLWFLRGDTNIKYLVDNDCHIWDGDAYKFYLAHYVDEYNEELEKKNEGLGWMAQELVNIRPLSKEQFINKIKTDDEFAKKFGELGPVYGAQWRRWSQNQYHNFGTGINFNEFNTDQITNLINDLKTNPDSRRLMVSAWNPSDLDSMVLPPCHYGFQVYTRELTQHEKYSWGMLNEDNPNIPTRAISLMYNARSQDVPLGTPFNIASYALLLEIIGRMVNMVPDELITNMGDCHIYKNQVDGVMEQLTREPYPLPKLVISGDINFAGTIDEFLNSCSISDFKIEGYQSHPTIKIPLSN